MTPIISFASQNEVCILRFVTKTPPNRLRVLRAEYRKTQRETATKAKVGPYRYWQIENGYTDPTPEERAALARFFRVPVDAVFPGVAA
jgi:transcriptional regulator with XRE-family HTH domain